jgi:hypothetical protein
LRRAAPEVGSEEARPVERPERASGHHTGALRNLLTALMVLGLGSVGYLYAARVPDLDPITVWPFALWVGIFSAIAVLLSPLLRGRRTVLLVACAFLAGLLLSEEPRFVLRGLWHDRTPVVAAAADSGELLRVISLNCGGGSERAIEHALSLDPDIVLLQESPGGVSLDAMLPEGWDRAGWGDCAVLVRGDAFADEHSRSLAHEMYVVRAVPERVGRLVTVISTHLVQPSLRGDLWRREVWREARVLRLSRMSTIEHLLAQRDRYGDLPVIIGGDFNTREGDPLLRPLEAAGLTDAFRAAGHGWPNTITSDFPVERIDFIWVDERFEPLSARVVVTPHSDHRMVVAELALRREARASPPHR